MSLAGEFSAGTPMAIRVLVRVVWLLALVYPVVFFAVVFFAERVLAAKNYAGRCGRSAADDCGDHGLPLDLETVMRLNGRIEKPGDCLCFAVSANPAPLKPTL